MNTSLIFPLLLSFFPGWILILKNYDELILDDLLITLSIIGITFVFWIIVIYIFYVWSNWNEKNKT